VHFVFDILEDGVPCGLGEGEVVNYFIGNHSDMLISKLD
jgi:hypothetical protein